MLSGMCGALAAVLSVTAVVPYVLATRHGAVRPARVTWLIFASLNSVSLAAQAAAGAGWSLLFPAGNLAACIGVLVVSIRRGTGGGGRRDVACLGLATLGLVGWALSHQAVVALLLALAVSGLAAGVTAAKAYRRPATETPAIWIVGGTAALLGAVSVGSWQPVLLLYPVGVAASNALIIASLIAGRRAALAPRGRATTEPEAAAVWA